MKSLLLFILLNICFFGMAAQPAKSSMWKWNAEAGLNFGINSESKHAGFNHGLTFKKGHYNLGVRYYRNTGLGGTPKYLTGQFISHRSLALLSGINFKAIKGLDFSFRSGISYNYFKSFTHNRQQVINTLVVLPPYRETIHKNYFIGFPVELSVLPKLSYSSGLEFCVYGNFSKANDMGIRLNYRIGKL